MRKVSDQLLEIEDWRFLTIWYTHAGEKKYFFRKFCVHSKRMIPILERLWMSAFNLKFQLLSSLFQWCFLIQLCFYTCFWNIVFTNGFKLIALFKIRKYNKFIIPTASHSDEFLQKGVLKICNKFTGDTHAEVWFQ